MVFIVGSLSIILFWVFVLCLDNVMSYKKGVRNNLINNIKTTCSTNGLYCHHHRQHIKQ